MTAKQLMAAMKPRRSKYNVDRSEAGKAARTYNGRVYDSKAEAAYAAGLDLKVKARLVRKWSPQVRVPLHVEGKLICTMVVDFKVFHRALDPTCPDVIEWIEYKGYESAVWKLKRKLFGALYPSEKYTVVGKLK